jgi:hypothetical protein
MAGDNFFLVPADSSGPSQKLETNGGSLKFCTQNRVELSTGCLLRSVYLFRRFVHPKRILCG